MSALIVLAGWAARALQAKIKIKDIMTGTFFCIYTPPAIRVETVY